MSPRRTSSAKSRRARSRETNCEATSARGHRRPTPSGSSGDRIVLRYPPVRHVACSVLEDQSQSSSDRRSAAHGAAREEPGHDTHRHRTIATKLPMEQLRMFFLQTWATVFASPPRNRSRGCLEAPVPSSGSRCRCAPAISLSCVPRKKSSRLSAPRGSSSRCPSCRRCSPTAVGSFAWQRLPTRPATRAQDRWPRLDNTVHLRDCAAMGRLTAAVRRHACCSGKPLG